MTYDELTKEIDTNTHVALKYLEASRDMNRSLRYRRMAGDLLLKTIRESLDLFLECVKIIKEMK